MSSLIFYSRAITSEYTPRWPHAHKSENLWNGSKKKLVDTQDKEIRLGWTFNKENDNEVEKPLTWIP